MKRRVWISILLLVLTVTAFSQQTEVLNDSVKRLLPHELPGSKQPQRISIDGFILPDITLSVPPISKATRDSITMPIIVPEFIVTPWPIPRLGEGGNPWAGDYNQYDHFVLNSKSYLSTYSTHNTYPTMGTFIEAGAAYSYQINRRISLSAGIYATKYTMPSFVHGSQLDAGLNASLGYRVNDRILIRAYGQYSINGQQNSTHGYLSPLAPQSSYGAIMELKVTDWLEIHGGMERSFDPVKGKWTTNPVLYPVIKLK